MARCAFSFWPWAAAPSARRADRTRRNIVNQLRVDNIGQRFFMTVRPGGKWKTERDPGEHGRRVWCSACAYMKFSPPLIFTSRWTVVEFSLPKKKKKNPPSDKRSSIIAISIFFSFLSFFPLLTHVAYFISFVESFGIRNWRQWFSKSRTLESILDSNFGTFVQHAIIRIDSNR